MAALGAGLNIAGGPAVAAVLDDPTYRAGAQCIAAEMAALPTAGPDGDQARRAGDRVAGLTAGTRAGEQRAVLCNING